MSEDNKIFPKSIRFSEDDIKRIEKAIVKKIHIEEKITTFSQFVIDAVMKEVKKIEKVRLEDMRDMILNAHYRKDITSFEKEIKNCLVELYPEASVEVGKDMVTFKIKTERNREAVSDEVMGALKKIIKN